MRLVAWDENASPVGPARSSWIPTGPYSENRSYSHILDILASAKKSVVFLRSSFVQYDFKGRFHARRVGTGGHCQNLQAEQPSY